MEWNLRYSFEEDNEDRIVQHIMDKQLQRHDAQQRFYKKSEEL